MNAQRTILQLLGASANDEAVEFIDSLPQEEKTPEVLMLSVVALCRRADKESCAKAVELLEEIKPFFPRDFSWNLRMGFARFFKEEPWRAIGFLMDAMRFFDGKDAAGLAFAKDLFEKSARLCAMPGLVEPFPQRARLAWGRFVEDERSFFDLEPERFKALFSSVVPGIEASVEFADGRRRVLFSTPASPAASFAARRLAAVAPAELKDRWRFACSDKEPPYPVEYAEFSSSCDPDPVYRADVFRGESLCMDLVEEWKHRISDSACALLDAGALPGFFTYSVDEVEDQKLFSRKFAEYMKRTAGDDAVKVLGWAEGGVYGYLDAVVWEPMPTFSAARGFLLSSGISSSSFNLFVWGASGMLLHDEKPKGFS